MMALRCGWAVLLVAGIAGCPRSAPEPDEARGRPGQILGPVEVTAWCAATGNGGRAVSTATWQCELDGVRRPVDGDEACRRQFPTAHAHLEIGRPGDPASWRCYAGSPDELGIMNVAGYCQTSGAQRAVLQDDGWRCVRIDGSLAPVDMDAACRFSFPVTPGVRARRLRPGNPRSWVCLRR